MRKTPSPFEDLLAQHRMNVAMEAKALKRVIAEQIEASMRTARLTKLEMAQKMGTSRSQLDRVLDPSNVSVQLDTLIKAARAVGKELIVSLRPMAKQAKAR
jgi:antitoxin HicB